MTEARLVAAEEGGLMPDGEQGWFVLNAKDARCFVYPADPVAQKHGAGVADETSRPDDAYKPFTFRKCGYEDGWLP